LYKNVRSKRLAKDLMSSPPIMIEAGVSCKEAANYLNRYNVNALLVVKNEKDFKKLIGFISRQVIEKAIFHGLDQVPVQEYMTS